MSRRRASSAGTRAAVGLCALLIVSGECMAQPLPAQPLVSQLSSELFLTIGQSRLALGALLALAQNRLLAEDFSALDAAVPNARELIELARREGVVNHPLDSEGELLEVLQGLGLNSQTAAAFAPAVRRWLSDGGQGAAADRLDQALE